MDIAELLIRWTPPNGLQTSSVLYFPAANSMTTIRNATATFVSQLQPALTTDTTWLLENSGRILRDTDGGIIGEWSDSALKDGAGTSTAEPVPDASQGLIRFITGVVVGRRFLKGRLFVPGIGSDQVLNGNLSAGAQVALGESAEQLQQPGVGQVIWHRPVGGSGGSAHPVIGSSAWNELAVLRRRRG